NDYPIPRLPSPDRNARTLASYRVNAADPGETAAGACPQLASAAIASWLPFSARSCTVGKVLRLRAGPEPAGNRPVRHRRWHRLPGAGPAGARGPGHQPAGLLPLRADRKYYRPTQGGYAALDEGTAGWLSLAGVVNPVLSRPRPPLPAPPAEEN
ncbi:MAG TPA: hypothetical protein VMV07_15530, partial [Streptosporangiaceae bacterium]|nr:hypothetical protein [Streptosporangiaceae bacterium]